MTPKYSNVTVKLTERNGNAFVILGTVTAALRRAGVKQSDIDSYMDDAMSGDYDHLLQVTMKTVQVE